MLAMVIAIAAAADVDVPLILGDGDPRPRVIAQVDERDQVLAFLDPTHAETRLGSLLAARLGLPVRHERGGRVATIRRIRVGELLLEDVEARVEYSDELVLGLAGVGSPIAILPSEGRVRIGDALPMDAEPTPLPELRLDRAWTEVAPERLVGPPTLRGGHERWWLAESLPVAELPPTWVGRADGSGWLGADALAGLDLVVDLAGDTLYASPSVRRGWQDAATWRLEARMVEAMGWPAPEPGDDLLGRLRWTGLGDEAWAAGRADLAIWAGDALELVAGERCELFLAIGERRLRAGVHTAASALRRSAELFDADPVEQDRTCARAGALLALVEGRAPEVLAPLGPEDGLAAALVAFRRGPLPEGPLRHAVAHGGRLDPAVRLALAVARPHDAAIRHVALLGDPAPLASALALAEAAGVDALRAGVAADPLWTAGRLVLLAHGADDPATFPLDEAVRLEGYRSPGEAGARCRAWLRERLGGGMTPPPEVACADCLAARVLLADAEARAALVARWPELAVKEVP